jgi:putative endonuclease
MTWVVRARKASSGSEHFGGPMTYFVYVLVSHGPKGCRTYVGWTTDLDLRLARHNGGTGARSTRGRQWLLLYAERHSSRGEAMSREWHLKRDRKFRKGLADLVAGV